MSSKFSSLTPCQESTLTHHHFSPLVTTAGYSIPPDLPESFHHGTGHRFDRYPSGFRSAIAAEPMRDTKAAWFAGANTKQKASSGFGKDPDVCRHLPQLFEAEHIWIYIYI